MTKGQNKMLGLNNLLRNLIESTFEKIINTKLIKKWRKWRRIWSKWRFKKYNKGKRVNR